VIAVLELFGIGVSVFGVVGVTAYFMYLSRLAQRVSVENRGSYTDVPEHTKALAYGYAVVLGWFALAGAVEVIWTWGPVVVGSGGPPGPLFTGVAGPFGLLGAAGGCISALACLALLVLFAAAIGLHIQMQAALRLEALEAEKHWADASKTPAQRADASGHH
jgi:hypothetical protein